MPFSSKPPAVVVTQIYIGLCLAVVMPGCKRESRNFETGGPSSNKINRDRFDKDFAGARGPLAEMDGNAYALSEGKRLYSNFNCVGCHANGGGDIGPALIDDKWLYGASPDAVYQSILEGRPNGMPAFRGRITETQCQQLTAYVRSMSGQATRNSSPSREDHMKTGPAENSGARQTPVRSKDSNP